MIQDFLMSELPRLIGYGICIGCFFFICYVSITRGTQVLDDLRGKDKIWQFIEVAAAMWIILFPVVVLLDALGVQISGHAWASLDAIFLMLVGGKVMLNKKKEEKENP